MQGCRVHDHELDVYGEDIRQPPGLGPSGRFQESHCKVQGNIQALILYQDKGGQYISNQPKKGNV